MSGIKGSPFYKEDDDLRFGRALWPMTCRCSGKPGFTLDGIRNMWVCGVCRKPKLTNETYIPTCFGCGTMFVLWHYDVKTSYAEVCTDCGGKNIAPPNEVTTDPVEALRKKIHGEVA